MFIFIHRVDNIYIYRRVAPGRRVQLPENFIAVHQRSPPANNSVEIVIEKAERTVESSLIARTRCRCFGHKVLVTSVVFYRPACSSGVIAPVIKPLICI